MKISKILAVVASLSVSTTAIAGPYDYQGRRDFHGYERREHHDHDDWVVPAIAGLVIGGIIVGSTRSEPHVRREQPREVIVQKSPYIYVNGRYFYYDQPCDCYR